MLEVSHLSKRFRKFIAVDDVSFNVQSGSTVLLIGPNGAGKTTIIRCLMGLLSFKGQVLVDSLDVRKRGQIVRSKIGYVPQQLIFPESKVLEHAKFVCRLKNVKDEAIPDKLKLMGLWDFKNSKIQALSAGQRQRYSIALALLNNPPILIFDEPISNVDIKGQMEFESIVSSLSKQGKTLLIATHFSGMSEYANLAIVLDHGKVIVSGSPEELLGRINAKNNLFVRIRNDTIEQAKDVIAKFNGDEITSEGEWIAAKVPTGSKIELVQELLHSNFDVQDLILEDLTIESEYVKLLTVKPTS